MKKKLKRKIGLISLIIFLVLIIILIILWNNKINNVEEIVEKYGFEYICINRLNHTFEDGYCYLEGKGNYTHIVECNWGNFKLNTTYEKTKIGDYFGLMMMKCNMHNSKK